jgi:hypothetical protein
VLFSKFNGSDKTVLFSVPRAQQNCTARLPSYKNIVLVTFLYVYIVRVEPLISRVQKY